MAFSVIPLKNGIKESVEKFLMTWIPCQARYNGLCHSVEERNLGGLYTIKELVGRNDLDTDLRRYDGCL